MSRILHVCGFFDPAGDVVRCVAELNRVSRHEHALIVRERHPLQEIMQFEEAESLGGSSICSWDMPPAMLEWADAILCHFVGWPVDWPKTDKPRAFRNLNIRYDEKADAFWSEPHYNHREPLENFKLTAASHVGAAEFLGSNFRWLPDLLPADKPEYAPQFAPRPPCVSFIKHAKELDGKNFGEFATKLNLAMRPHAEILRRRRTEATVVIDNVCDGHWGLAGNEALALGLPCIVFNHRKTKSALRALIDAKGYAGNAPKEIEINKRLDSPFLPFDEVESLDEAVEHARQLTRWDRDMFHGLRRDLRAWFERHLSSENLVPLLWDPFFEELAGTGK